MKTSKKIIIHCFSEQVATKAKDLFDEVWISCVHKLGIKKARKYRGQKNLRFNIGAGDYLKEGFVNLDFSPSAAVRLDLRQPLPFENECCELVFSEHFVEHLYYPEGVDLFFSEAFRVLEKGGKISLSVPETSWPIMEYSGKQTDYLQACLQHQWHPPEVVTFMERINYHFRQRRSGMSDGNFAMHRFAYDFETMKVALERNGFTNVEERPFDPAIDSEHRRVGSLFVQGMKPNH